MVAVVPEKAPSTDQQMQKSEQETPLTDDRVRLLEECALLVWEKMAKVVKTRTTYTVNAIGVRVRFVLDRKQVFLSPAEYRWIVSYIRQKLEALHITVGAASQKSFRTVKPAPKKRLLLPVNDDPEMDVASFAAIGINPIKATEARPGSEEKVLMLCARYAAGLPLWDDDDNQVHGPRIEG